jgi:PAS domain S-box-containing protein
VIEAELFALLEQTADAAYSVTESGEICSWNGAAERLLGYPAKEVVGRNIEDLLQARDVLGTPAFAGGFQAMTRHWPANGGIPNFDVEVRTRSGDRIWMNVSTIFVDNHLPGRRLFVRLAHGIEQRRHNEELFHRLLTAARQLVALADETQRHTPVESLSQQERRILKLFAEGRNSTTIARNLSISPQTLRNHLHHINRKLRTRNRLEAVTHAQQRGLLD